MARVRLTDPRWRLYATWARRALVALAVALLALDWLRKFDAVRHNPLAAGAAASLVIAACAFPVARVVGRSISRTTLRRRFEAGRCLRCGYPMTGNVSGVCPECGRRFVPARRIAMRLTLEAAMPFLKPKDHALRRLRTRRT